MPAEIPPSDADHSGMERRLATILAADVAGYSRMMGENEEATVETLRGHRAVFDALLKQHRGRVFNTAGDAILAEFPSAVDAVRCATEIQAALQTRNAKLPPERKMVFRMGINLGDVIVQGTDLLGDGVNVAARIQTVAEPGGICISGSVYDQILNKLTLQFQTLGDQTFKNIARPVRTFTITHGEVGAIPAAMPRPPAKSKGPAMVWAIVAIAAIAVAAGAYGFYRVMEAKQAEQTALAVQAAADKQAAEDARRAAAEESQRAAEAARVAEAERTAAADKRAAEEQAEKHQATAATVSPPALAKAHAPSAGTSDDGTYNGNMCNFPFNPDKKKCWPVPLIIQNGGGTGNWTARMTGKQFYAHVTLGRQGIVTVAINGTNDNDVPRNGALSGRIVKGAIVVNGEWANGTRVDGHWTRVN